MEFYLRAQFRSEDATLKKDQWGKAVAFYQHDHAKLRAQFVAEMRQLSKLRHPCICTVMGACNSRPGDTSEPMLVMGKFFFGKDVLVVEFVSSNRCHFWFQQN